jgi:hypothetical protein
MYVYIAVMVSCPRAMPGRKRFLRMFPAGRALQPDHGGLRRVIFDCHFAVQLGHFIPVLLSYSVAVFLK